VTIYGQGGWGWEYSQAKGKVGVDWDRFAMQPVLTIFVFLVTLDLARL